MLIETHDLTKVYHLGETDVHALAGVSATIAEGEFVAVMGPSGSGKSTFMNVIGCLDVPTSGTYRFNGEDVAGLVHRRTGRHPQPLDRLRVPAVQPAARARRRWKTSSCRCSTAACRRRSAARARCRSWSRSGLARASDHHPGAAFRRPAAARRHRARAGQRSQADPRRRAHRRARFGDEPRGDGAAAGAQPLRHHDRRRHARAGHRDVRVAADRVPRREDRLRHAQRARGRQRRARRTPQSGVGCHSRFSHARRPRCGESGVRPHFAAA